MSKDLNQCTFIGNITKDLDPKYMPGGTCVINFSIACNDDYKKDGVEVKLTNFIDLVCFGKPAEIIAQYLGKGSKLCVSGKLTKRKWQDKNGENRYTTEVNVQDFYMLGNSAKSSDVKPAQTPAKPIEPAVAGDSFDDDIPF